jgi:hypothetical protein
MQGMDTKHDGHPWCVVKTTHIKNNYGLNFRQVACVNHLHYAVEDCPSLLRDGKPNEAHWEGATLMHFCPTMSLLHIPQLFASFVKHPLLVFPLQC